MANDLRTKQSDGARERVREKLPMFRESLNQHLTKRFNQPFDDVPAQFFHQRASLIIMSGKIAKALIGGNWKCNGTTASVKAMAEVLNKAGPFSANSEVVIAAPSIHLLNLKSIIRPDIAVASEVSF